MFKEDGTTWEIKVNEGKKHFSFANEDHFSFFKKLQVSVGDNYWLGIN